MNAVSPEWERIVAALLLLAVLAASARTAWHAWRTPHASRPRAWRIATLLLLQAATAFLLFQTLFPPARRAPAGVLVVATADADRLPTEARIPGARLVAMPEAPALPGAQRMPDLATALRRHPGTTRVRVLGSGLVPRDLDAARGVAVEFRPAPLPRGLVALWPPRDAVAGRRFEVAGRTQGLAGGQVALLDPGGRVVAQVASGDDGRFRLAAVAHAPGPTSWTLRLHARDRAGTAGAVVEAVAVPLDVAPGARLRVLLLAGAPDAELKYLRRWAMDAGLALETRIELGAGLQVGDAPLRFDAATLAGQDLVVLDARSWQALGTRRAPLLQAVRNGLGLLLRVPQASAPADRAAWRQLGFQARSASTGVARLAGASRNGPGTDAPPQLTRGSLRISGDAAVPLLPDAEGAALAWWRALGLGRIGIAGFDDSYRLVLAGHGDRHGDLWATLFTTLARPRADIAAQPMSAARVGERVVLCALPAGAVVEAPDGGRVRLQPDPPGAAPACAGFWPRMPGWHLLRGGAAVQRFHVRANSDAPGLRAAQLRAGTAELATMASAPAPGLGPPVRGPRWPWFLAWLALATAGWWLERSRHGLRATPGVP